MADTTREDGWLRTGMKFIGNAAESYLDAAGEAGSNVGARLAAGIHWLKNPSKSYNEHLTGVRRRHVNQRIVDVTKRSNNLKAQNNNIGAMGHDVGDFFGSIAGDPAWAATGIALGLLGKGYKAYKAVPKVKTSLKTMGDSMQTMSRIPQATRIFSGINPKRVAMRTMSNPWYIKHRSFIPYSELPVLGKYMKLPAAAKNLPWYLSLPVQFVGYDRLNRALGFDTAATNNSER